LPAHSAGQVFSITVGIAEGGIRCGDIHLAVAVEIRRASIPFGCYRRQTSAAFEGSIRILNRNHALGKKPDTARSRAPSPLKSPAVNTVPYLPTDS